jgi:hypothetical protein
LRLRDGALVLDVAGIKRGLWLDEHDLDFFVCAWAMLHAARHDKKLSGFDLNISGAELHSELSLDHQEELVFVLMMVPDEFTLELGELYIVLIELADDLGGKMVREER